MFPGTKDLSLSGAASAPKSRTSHTAWGDPKRSFREGSLGCEVAAAEELWGTPKEMGAGSMVWADVLGLVACMRVGDGCLCYSGLRNDLNHGGN